MREIALHILDIVQNSLGAEAQKIIIRVIENTAEDCLSFTIEDDGKGMSPEVLARAVDPFYTTRTTRRVGLGLPMLKTTCLSCEGSFDISSILGEGTKVSASYRLSHIDRPPLGDMAATMLTILLGNEDIDYDYHHEKDGVVFAFSSRQMKEVLEGLPFHNPDVYSWLKEYLTEGENSIVKS